MVQVDCLSLILLLLLLVLNVYSDDKFENKACKLGFDTEFPDEFEFGAASAAYQVEGAWNLDGKGENIWDHGLHQHPEKTADRSNGDVAADSYHQYQEDVNALMEVGFHFYRFSISWARILPTGELSSLNEKGLDYYHNLINALVENNIKPVVTMYHWDAPQAVEDKGGFLNKSIIDYFEIYANVLFKHYGDKVKNWITFNEPLGICLSSYEGGGRPPWLKMPGTGGYICAHHVLLSHARIYRLYRKKYYNTQKGKIGLSLDTTGHLPKTDSPEDLYAADRAYQFSLGWFGHAIFSKQGGYPSVMMDTVARKSKAEGRKASRLPEFTQSEIKDVQGTADFFALNYYSSRIVSLGDTDSDSGASYEKDIGVKREIDPSWKRAKSGWLYSVPKGLRYTLSWIKNQYNNPEIWITENGWSDDGHLNDVERIQYYKEHLTMCLESIICDEVYLKKYTAWSLIDNFEWLQGYTEKFGLYYVDFNSVNRERTPKHSSYFFKEIIRSKTIQENCSSSEFPNRKGFPNTCSTLDND